MRKDKLYVKKECILLPNGAVHKIIKITKNRQLGIMLKCSCGNITPYFTALPNFKKYKYLVLENITPETQIMYLEKNKQQAVKELRGKLLLWKNIQIINYKIK